jgi:hypothetical protein
MVTVTATLLGEVAAMSTALGAPVVQMVQLEETVTIVLAVAVAVLALLGLTLLLIIMVGMVGMVSYGLLLATPSVPVAGVGVVIQLGSVVAVA